VIRTRIPCERWRRRWRPARGHPSDLRSGRRRQTTSQLPPRRVAGASRYACWTADLGACVPFCRRLPALYHVPCTMPAPWAFGSTSLAPPPPPPRHRAHTIMRHRPPVTLVGRTLGSRTGDRVSSCEVRPFVFPSRNIYFFSPRLTRYSPSSARRRTARVGPLARAYRPWVPGVTEPSLRWT
jgi:hypothetical protein